MIRRCCVRMMDDVTVMVAALSPCHLTIHVSKLESNLLVLSTDMATIPYIRLNHTLSLTPDKDHFIQSITRIVSSSSHRSKLRTSHLENWDMS